MANSSELTGSIEKRNKEPHVKPVWERDVAFTVETGGGTAEISKKVLVNGQLKEIVIQVGAAAGITGTVNVDLDDSNGIEFDTNVTLAEGSETIVTFDPPKAVTNFTIRFDPSAAPTSGEWVSSVFCRGV